MDWSTECQVSERRSELRELNAGKKAERKDEQEMKGRIKKRINDCRSFLMKKTHQVTQFSIKKNETMTQVWQVWHD